MSSESSLADEVTCSMTTTRRGLGWPEPGRVVRPVGSGDAGDSAVGWPKRSSRGTARMAADAAVAVGGVTLASGFNLRAAGVAASRSSGVNAGMARSGVVASGSGASAVERHAWPVRPDSERDGPSSASEPGAGPTIAGQDSEGPARPGSAGVRSRRTFTRQGGSAGVTEAGLNAPVGAEPGCG